MFLSVLYIFIPPWGHGILTPGHGKVWWAASAAATSFIAPVPFALSSAAPLGARKMSSEERDVVAAEGWDI